MIDLDSLRGIVSRATGTGWQAAYRQDVEALIAEVERLRNEVSLLQEEAVVARSCETWLTVEVERLRNEVSLLQQEARIRHNINKGLVAELKAERAAVVAWLRDCDKVCREWDGQENAVSRTYRLAAACIEYGKHRGEEKL